MCTFFCSCRDFLITWIVWHAVKSHVLYCMCAVTPQSCHMNCLLLIKKAKVVGFHIFVMRSIYIFLPLIKKNSISLLYVILSITHIWWYLFVYAVMVISCMYKCSHGCHIVVKLIAFYICMEYCNNTNSLILILPEFERNKILLFISNNVSRSWLL